ncbi:CMRF35-like molecule 2 [Rhea pennata]|uniref:CMRF35-like molecule 2 n=1 Tax=Rhea pennata TaxID=8795 RepID=UPI002E26384C
MSLGWGWLLLPVCRALVAPREVGGRLGETLSVRCWYTRGYEGYNKYWCRGASRDSCRKVVETAGPEAPQRRGRVSIADNHVFCVVLLTVEHLSEEDAGSYWCAIERLGRDLMEPVEVAVFPALSATSAALHTSPTAWTPVVSTITDRMKLPNTTNAATPGSPRPVLTVVVPSVALASLLAAISSAVLICTLIRRRKEARQRPLGEASRPRQHKPAAGSQAPGDPPPPHPGAARASGAAWLGNVYSNSAAAESDGRQAVAGAPRPPPPAERPPHARGPGARPPPRDLLLYTNAPWQEEAPGSWEETDCY